ncbi:unnamed protein product [Closterium sp. NIES-53]
MVDSNRHTGVRVQRERAGRRGERQGVCSRAQGNGAQGNGAQGNGAQGNGAQGNGAQGSGEERRRGCLHGRKESKAGPREAPSSLTLCSHPLLSPSGHKGSGRTAMHSPTGRVKLVATIARCSTPLSPCLLLPSLLPPHSPILPSFPFCPSLCLLPLTFLLPPFPFTTPPLPPPPPLFNLLVILFGVIRALRTSSVKGGREGGVVPAPPLPPSL